MLGSEDVDFAKQTFRVLYMQQMLQCKKIIKKKKTSGKAQSSVTFVAFACVRLFGFKCLKLFIFILLATGKYIVSLTKTTVWWHVKEQFIYSLCLLGYCTWRKRLGFSAHFLVTIVTLGRVPPSARVGSVTFTNISLNSAVGPSKRYLYPWHHNTFHTQNGTHTHTHIP